MICQVATRSFLIGVVALLCLHTSAVFAQSGPDTGPAAIIYINGVLTEKLDAQVSALRLQDALTATTADGIDVDYVHNPSGGLFKDLFESTLQSIDPSDFVRMMVRISEWTPAFQNAFIDASNATAAQAEETGRVRDELQDRIKLREEAGNKVIIVSHSQGNFFANAAYQNLTEQQRSCAFQVGVASPDRTQSHAHYEYVTLTEDMVIFAAAQGRAVLSLPTAPPTTSTEFANLPIWSNSLGHSFVDAYLFADTDSRREILTYIASARDAPRPDGSDCAPPEDPLPPGVGPSWTFVFDQADMQLLGQSSCTRVLIDCLPWYHGLRALDGSAADHARVSLQTGNFIAKLGYTSDIGFRSLSVTLDGTMQTRSAPQIGPDSTLNYYPYGETRGVLTMSWNLNATGYFSDHTPIANFVFTMSGESSAEFAGSPVPVPATVDSEDPYPGVPICSEPQIQLTKEDSGATITLGGIFGTDTKTGSIASGQYIVTVTATADQLRLNSGVLDEDVTAFPRREISCRLLADFRLTISPPLR